MKRYQYQTVISTNIPEMDRNLNAFGGDGWEAYAVTEKKNDYGPTTSTYSVFLKKEI